MRTAKQNRRGSTPHPLFLVLLSFFASHCGLDNLDGQAKPRVVLQPASVSSGEGIKAFQIDGFPVQFSWTVSSALQADYTLQTCPGTGEDSITGCIDVLSFRCLGRSSCVVV